jgi:hypothetical protein
MFFIKLQQFEYQAKTNIKRAEIRKDSSKNKSPC